MKNYSALLCLVSVSLIGSFSFGADTASWTNVDIYGGQILSLAMNPLDHNVLFAASIQTLYKSTDGAATWQATDVSGNITGIAYSPADTEVVYVCGGCSSIVGISKSLDGGATWAQLPTSAALASIACDPVDANIAYANDRQNNPAHVYKTTDGGNAWKVVYTLPQDFTISRLAMAADHIIVTAQKNFDGDGAIFYSANAGADWTEFTASYFGLANLPVYSLTVDPDNPLNVFAGGWSYIFRSLDGGATWSKVPVDTTGGMLQQMRVVMMADLGGNTLLAFKGANFYKSLDSGATWVAAGTVDSTPGGPMSGGLCDPVGDSSTIYLPDAMGYGMYKSTDGVTFHNANTNIRGVRFLFLHHNSIEKNVFYAGSDVDFYRSKDSGSSWTRLLGLNGLRAGLGDMIVPPSNPASVIACQQVMGNIGEAIVRSDDYGDTWRLLSYLPVNSGGVLKFAFEPGNSAVAYAGVGSGIMSPRPNDGLYKSIDSGNAWRPIAFPGSVISFIAVDPQDTLTLYAGKGQFCQQKNDNTTGAYKSIDGGLNWTQMPVPKDIVTSLVIDPDDPTQLYIATISNGLFHSSDRGTTWTNINNQMQISAFVITKTVDNKKALCFAGGGGTIYISVDGGNTWQMYSNGFNVINALCAGSLYAATNTGLYKTKINKPNGVALARTPAALESVRAYPDPGRNQVNFVFNLSAPTRVEIDVFNLQGKRVAALSDNLPGNGVAMTWNCHGAARGVYFACVNLGRTSTMKLRMAIVK